MSPEPGPMKSPPRAMLRLLAALTLLCLPYAALGMWLAAAKHFGQVAAYAVSVGLLLWVVAFAARRWRRFLLIMAPIWLLSVIFAAYTLPLRRRAWRAHGLCARDLVLGGSCWLFRNLAGRAAADRDITPRRDLYRRCSTLAFHSHLGTVAVPALGVHGGLRASHRLCRPESRRSHRRTRRQPPHRHCDVRYRTLALGHGVRAGHGHAERLVWRRASDGRGGACPDHRRERAPGIRGRPMAMRARPRRISTA